MPSTFTCRTCGEIVTRKIPQRTYCSRVCMAADYAGRFAGSGNPAWRGGGWGYKGRGWYKMPIDAACQDCGVTEGLLRHHLVPQRFWIDLDRANDPANLVTLCIRCHPRRPEHYWVELPAERYVPGLHLPTPPVRTRARLRPYPPCQVCGQPCKRHRSRFCSYACSNRARWQAGIYGPDLARNITRTRWELPKSG